MKNAEKVNNKKIYKEGQTVIINNGSNNPCYNGKKGRITHIDNDMGYPRIQVLVHNNPAIYTWCYDLGDGTMDLEILEN